MRPSVVVVHGKKSQKARNLKSYLSSREKDLVAPNMAQPLPKPRPGAAIRALGIAAHRGARHNAAEDVAGAAAANADRRGLLAHLGALELLVEGQGGALRRGVDVSGAAAARVEARGARGGGGGRAGRDAGGGGGLGGAEEVAGAAAAGVGVGVLEHGGVRLGDGVGGHFGGGLGGGWCEGWVAGSFG